MCPYVLGVGFLGKNFKDSEDTESYIKWRGMLERCYDSNYHKKYPSYVGCTICEEWKNYSKFKIWFDNHYIEGYQLDKDILIKGNKIYSPNTCCFVPAYINALFTKANTLRGNLPIGVKRAEKSKRFVAFIRINNKAKRLGTYDTPEEAFQAYKVAKETWIKEVANKWKGKIADNVYEAMMKYEVEITD